MQNARCTRCGAWFDPADDASDACRHHPGRLMDYDRSMREHPTRYGRGGAVGDFWSCCHAQVDNEGFAPGCTTGPHVAEPAPGG